MQSKYQIADVLKALGTDVENVGLNTWQLRTLSALRKCRTAELGGHIDACDECGVLHISYNSCRNRHCPKCQGHKREEWMQARQHELLPVPYFHVVFTLPEAINTLAMHQPKQVYDALFKATWQTIEQFGKKKEVQTGMIALLHTWGQTLSLHPHLHCIVPGGGVGKNGRWKNIRSDGKYLFPVKALSKMFRAKYVSILSKSVKLDKSTRDKLFEKPWVVYAKRPFGSPKSVIEYLGRYTHKIAISNHRLQGIEKDSVSFAYKDYKQNGNKKVMTLSHKEFIRRFAQHILPSKFVKIRHYGFLSSTWKRKKLKELQSSFKRKIAVVKPCKIESKLKKCPCCKTGNLIVIEVFDKRGPPQKYLGDCQTKTPDKK